MNKRSLQDVSCGDLDDEDLSVKPAPDDEDYRAPIMASSSAGPSNKRTRPSEPGHSTKAGGTSSSNIKGSPSKKAPVEKRQARVKKSCPKNIMDRVARVQTQRFFLIDRIRQDGELREEFKVLGSTGNVYTVVIQHVPECDCPDAQKGNHCKHILFAFLKVLGQSAASFYYYQKALLSSELEDIFAHAPPNPKNVMSDRLTYAFKKSTGEAQDEDVSEDEKKTLEDEAVHGKRRLPQEGDACPVCYEDFEAGQTKGLVFCSDSCGGALHQQCFQQWSAASGGRATCVYCRAPWPQAAGASSSALPGVSDEGYTNLASALATRCSVAGVSPQRDTSSYYHGPRRSFGGSGYQCGYAGRRYRY